MSVDNVCLVEGCMSRIWDLDYAICANHWRRYTCMECDDYISLKISIVTGLCVQCRRTVWLKVKI